MKFIFQGSQKRHVRVAISQKGLSQIFQKSYFKSIQGLKVHTLPSVLIVTSPRLVSSPGGMWSV